MRLHIAAGVLGAALIAAMTVIPFAFDTVPLMFTAPGIAIGVVVVLGAIWFAARR